MGNVCWQIGQSTPTATRTLRPEDTIKVALVYLLTVSYFNFFSNLKQIGQLKLGFFRSGLAQLDVQ